MIADTWHSPPVRCARGFAPPLLERDAACGGEIVQRRCARGIDLYCAVLAQAELP
jgi:hypothetical protein